MTSALVLGELCVDVILYNPVSVSVLGEPVWAEDIVCRLGGSASYVAQGLKSLGLDVHLSSVVGDDPVSRHCIDQLKLDGIHVDTVKRLDRPSPICIGTCEHGKKSFVGCAPLLKYSSDLLDFSVRDSDLIYFGGYLLYPELWDGCLADFFEENKGQALIAVDTQFLPIPVESYKTEALQPKNLQNIDILYVNQREAIALTGCNRPTEAAEVLGNLGPRIVVVKLGKEGSLTWTSESSYVNQAFKVNARDPIGAGDYFGAAFSYCLLQPWTLEQAGEFANAFTALCIGRSAEENLPSRSDVLALMKDTKRGF